MSGIKRKIEDNDPDYEDILLAQNSKRNKVEEHNGKPGCSELWQFTCPTRNDAWNTRVPTVIPRLVDLHFITVFYSPRSYSTEDWNHHKTAVFFRDEEQRAWDRCDQPGIRMIIEGFHIFFKVKHDKCDWWKKNKHFYSQIRTFD